MVALKTPAPSGHVIIWYQFIERSGSDIRGHRKVRTLRSREWKALGVDMRCVSNPSPRRQRQEFEAILGYIVKLCLKERPGREEGKEKAFQIMKHNVSKVNADPDDGSRKRKWGSENPETLEGKCLHRNSSGAGVRTAEARGSVGTCSSVTAVVLAENFLAFPISVGCCLVPDIFTG